DLVDAGEPVLDRVLHGDDVPVRRVDHVEGGVEGGRLPRPRRPRDEDRPVGLAEAGLEAGQDRGVEPEVGQRQAGLGLVQDPHDDLLPVDRRQRGHPQVDPLPATLREIRPSWGMRRSAMLMSAMTLSRLITPPWIDRGECMTSWRTPSTRKRIRRSVSVGSTWMSDARSATAWAIRRFTNLTI